MKLTKTIFLAAMAAGLLVGSSAGAQDASTNVPPGASTNSFRAHMAPHAPPDISRLLNLTDDQKAKVDPILADEHQKISAVLQDTTLSTDDKRGKIMEIRQNTSDQMKPILTPEQFQKWQRMRSFLRRTAVPPPPGLGAPGTGTNAPAAKP